MLHFQTLTPLLPKGASDFKKLAKVLTFKNFHKMAQLRYKVIE